MQIIILMLHNIAPLNLSSHFVDPVFLTSCLWSFLFCVSLVFNQSRQPFSVFSTTNQLSACRHVLTPNVLRSDQFFVYLQSRLPTVGCQFVFHCCYRVCYLFCLIAFWFLYMHDNLHISILQIMLCPLTQSVK